MEYSRLKNKISIAFKMHGLTLKSDASKYLSDVLSAIGSANQQKLEELELFNGTEEITIHQDSCLDKIIDAVLKQALNSTMITKEIIKKGVSECIQKYSSSSKDSKVLSVINAFEMPKYSYCTDKKKFLENSLLGAPPPNLFPDASCKSFLFHQRYLILHQLISRHEVFTPAVFGVNEEEDSKKFQLYPIEYLLGTTTKMKNLVILGMLSHIEEGKYHLEDPTGSMILNLSDVQYHSGIFAENNFILAEGWFEDGVFSASAIGLPPIENASVTRSYFGNINFCGVDEAHFKTSKKYLNIEKHEKDSMFVTLSEVWIDQAKVLQKLKHLFSGFSLYPPTCFIFIGNFISDPHKSSDRSLVSDCFKKLGELIAEFPSIVEKSQFVFVPGPNDIGLKSILPRPAIPDSVTSSLRDKVPNSIFTTNPARIQYCTQEIVIFRADLLSRISRHCIHFPTEGNINSHLVKTILSQVHLCPVPIHAQPIYWEYDNALRLYPLPDLLIYADNVDSYNTSMAGTNVMNPGNFSKSNYIFKVYMPADKTIEDSQIVQDDEN